MKKGYCRVSMTLLVIIYIFITQLRAEEFQYPYYLLDTHHTTTECWVGIDSNGLFPLAVDLNDYIVGPPPSVENSAVTIPTDSWVELMFRGVIVDGPGYDLFISEMDPLGEQALIFLTDGAGQDYLLAKAEVPNTDIHLPTILGFDLAGLSLPFEPIAVRVVGIDLRGGSPGFDLSFVNARISEGNSEIVRYPYPPDKAKSVPVNTVLSWLPSSKADKYNVYFGTDISSVYPDAGPVSVLGGQDANSYDPNTLEMGKTYYWRVDQVNDTGPKTIIRGDIWSFTVANKFSIDDFEAYKLQYPLGTKWTPDPNYSHTYINFVTSPDLVHLCQQAMEIGYYYSSDIPSLVTYSFEKPQDWIAEGVKTIELYFRGVMNNYKDCIMYICLDDGINKIKIPYNGDTNDISLETWNLWQIDLLSLGLVPSSNTGNMPKTENEGEQINFRNIRHFSILIEANPDKPSSFGWGLIYIDDIRLFPSRCLAENRPKADFNGDCIVDFRDFSELAGNWLENGCNIYQVHEPNRSPIFWYQFDNDFVDTIGNAHGDLISGSPYFVPGVFGQALHFNGTSDVIRVFPVSHIFSKIEKGITVAFWQKGDDSVYRRDNLLCSDYQYNVSNPAISINLGCWNGTGIYNWDCGTQPAYDRRLFGKHRYINEWANQWNHWAFTKDIKTGVMQVFRNGVLINSRPDSSKAISSINSFTIGTGWYGGYDGLIDDMRIYDYALAQPEIDYIATNGTGIFDLPLMTPADLQKDNIINYSDLQVLAETWLTNHLFP